MKILTFRKKAAKKTGSAAAVSAVRQTADDRLEFNSPEIWEKDLYDCLRYKIPIIDAAISKIVRLTGGYKVVCSDEKAQEELDRFVNEIPVGVSGRSLQTFTDSYLDSLITYGNAVGEITADSETMQAAGLFNGNPFSIEVHPTCVPGRNNYVFLGSEGKRILIQRPELIVFSALNPPPGKSMGLSVLRGLPALSGVLLKIYKSIGQNYERAGNIRYAVTYKPGDDPSERAYSKERAMQIAKEWSEGMNAGRYGEVRDFVAVGDVDIKVIGAENQLFDTEIPVRQILEQLIAKLSIPPFLLGLSWSTTERMSSQQADILTSELEYYRRLLTPVIRQVCTTFLRLSGSDGDVTVEWENINLQDEVSLAEARLKNAQAAEIEKRMEKELQED